MKSNMTNCPNCGAVITGDKCEYCGTLFKQPDVGIVLEGRQIWQTIKDEKDKMPKYKITFL